MFAAWPCSLASPAGSSPTPVPICWVGVGAWLESHCLPLPQASAVRVLLGLWGTEHSHLPGWGGHPAFPNTLDRGVNHLASLPSPPAPEPGRK